MRQVGCGRVATWDCANDYSGSGPGIGAIVQRGGMLRHSESVLAGQNWSFGAAVDELGRSCGAAIRPIEVSDLP